MNLQVFICCAIKKCLLLTVKNHSNAAFWVSLENLMNPKKKKSHYMSRLM